MFDFEDKYNYFNCFKFDRSDRVMFKKLVESIAEEEGLRILKAREGTVNEKQRFFLNKCSKLGEEIGLPYDRETLYEKILTGKI